MAPTALLHTDVNTTSKEISMERKAKKKNTEEKSILHKKKVDSHFFRKFAVLIRKFLKTVRNLRIANTYFAPCLPDISLLAGMSVP